MGKKLSYEQVKITILRKLKGDTTSRKQKNSRRRKKKRERGNRKGKRANKNGSWKIKITAERENLMGLKISLRKNIKL